MQQVDRRHVLLALGAALAATALRSSAAAAFDWSPIPPAEAGFDPEIEVRLDKLIADKRAWNLHGVIVVRGQRIVLERYFEGEDNNWGKLLGSVRFGPNTLHNVYSVTKSIVALIYGIALAEGKVPPPDVPLYAQFPEYADLIAADARRKQQTIADALTMTLGTRWNETGIPYDGPANDEIGMEMAKDRYRFILERPVVGVPGKRWVYNGGATALLGRIIAKGAGKPLPDYAREALFDPVGIGTTEWIANKDTWVTAQFGMGDGEPAAASGLRMVPRDLARIGQLLLDNGAVDGRQVVPAAWLKDCVTPRVSADEQRRYGFQWYIGDFAFGTRTNPRLERWWGCFGNGGQRLFVMPDLDLVVVTTAGNYNTDDQWIPPIRVLREVVLASVSK